MSNEERLARIEEHLVNIGAQLSRALVNQDSLGARVQALELTRARAEGAVFGGRLVAALLGGAGGAGLIELLSHGAKLFGR